MSITAVTTLNEANVLLTMNMMLWCTYNPTSRTKSSSSGLFSILSYQTAYVKQAPMKVSEDVQPNTTARPKGFRQKDRPRSAFV
eukprot:6175295-Pleurochrysis_carterae.AAC.3